jgi:hypothetical protein
MKPELKGAGKEERRQKALKTPAMRAYIWRQHDEGSGGARVGAGEGLGG